MHKLYEKNRRLFSVTIELTSICSFKCMHCYNGYDTKSYLEFDSLKKFLETLKDNGVFEIDFTGGDVFLYKNFKDLIIFCRNLGFNVHLLTNLYSCTFEQLKFLKDLNVASLQFTIFSMNEAINDFMTKQKGSLKRILENVENCKKLGINLTAKNEITNLDPFSFRKFVDYCKENNIKYSLDYFILNRIDGEKVSQEFLCSDDDLPKVIKEVSLLQYEILGYPNADDLVCMEALTSCFIQSNGDVFPCVFFREKLGNIFSNSFQEIEQSRLNCVATNLKFCDLEDKCKSCEDLKYCKRCPGKSLLENKKPNEHSDLECKISKIRREVNYGSN